MEESKGIPAPGVALADPGRLAALAGAGVLDTPAEERFDRLTRLVRRALGVPVALVSLVEPHRQFFKSAAGLPEPWASRRETPLSHSFCQHVVTTDAPLIVEDAREHPLVRDDRALSEIGVVSYLGVPLRLTSGDVLGSLCAIDGAPRTWTEHDRETMGDLAALVVAELEAAQRVCWADEETALARKFETRFANIVCNGSEAVTLVDAEGRRLFQSTTAKRLFGYDTEEMLGRNVLEFVHPDDLPSTREAFGRLVATGEPVVREFRLRNAEGAWRWVESSAANLLADPSVEGIVIHTRDVTDRKRTEVRRAEEHRILEMVAQRVPLPHVLEAVCGLIEGEIDDGMCSILLLEDGVRLRRGAAPSLPEAYSEAIDGITIGAGVGSCGTAAFCGDVVVASDIDTDPRWADFRGLARAHGLGSCFSVPIRTSTGEVSGTFAVYHRAPAAPSEQDLRVVELGAYLAGIAVENVRSEQALRASERSFRSLAEATAQIVWRRDADGCNLLDRCHWAAYTGLPEKACERNGWLAAVHPEDRSRLLPIWAAHRAEGRALEGECRVQGADGVYRWFSMRAVPVFDDEGRLCEWVGTAIDVDAQRQAEAALRASEQRLRVLVETAQEGVWLLDAEGRTTFVNERMALMLGCSPEELMGERYDAFVDEAHRAEADAYFERRRQGLQEDHDFLFRRRDGSGLWAIVSATPSFDADGVFTGAVGMLTDITDRKAAEQALRASEARLRLALESGHMGTWDWDMLHDAVTWSPQTFALFGRDERTFEGRKSSFEEAVHPEDRAAVGRANREVRERGGMVDLEYRIVRPDGAVRWMHSRGRLLRDAEGRPARLIGTVADVTERKEASEALRRAKLRYEQLVHGIDGIVWEATLDRATRAASFVFVSERLRDVLGYEPEAWLADAREWVAALADEDRAWVPEAAAAAIAEGRDFTQEYRLRAADGRIVWVRAIVSVLGERDGVVTAAGITIDVTKRRAEEDALREAKEQAEEARRQAEAARRAAEAAQRAAEDMAQAKSALLNNMSHEIRTPLTAVIGFADLLAEEVPGPQREMATVIQRSGRRLLATLNSVLDLAQLESGALRLAPERLDVGREVAEVAELFVGRAGEKGLLLVVEPGPAPVWADVDRGALQRVLVNLVENAVKFTARGRVAVRVERDLAAPGGPTVQLTVRDTGIGMDAAFVSKVFEPFRQESVGLRREHEGNGLGLAIVKRLVELMDGRIEVESRKGEGTTVRILLPVDGSDREDAGGAAGSGAARGAEAADPLPPPAEPDRPCLLLVEDHAVTRTLVVRMLEAEWDVVAVATAEEALAGAGQAHFDLVLLDLNLGGALSGLDVLEALRALPLGAALPVLALTAQALPGDREALLAAGFDDYVAKPFAKRQLLEHLARARAA